MAAFLPTCYVEFADEQLQAIANETVADGVVFVAVMEAQENTATLLPEAVQTYTPEWQEHQRKAQAEEPKAEIEAAIKAQEKFRQKELARQWGNKC